MISIEHGGQPASLREISHHTDVCVVGGGLAGVCAAVEAARQGSKVVLMHDRPMFGGNASSEVRMWVCGAHGKNNRETGIIDELMQENLYRNPDKNYSIWDGIIYSIVKAEPNISVLLNCSCNACHMEGNRVASVVGWQLSTQTYHRVYPKLFVDSSGDSILAPLSGALYRHGREGKSEFDESIAPNEADRKTMGMSLLLQARQLNKPVDFIPPSWANHYTEEKLPNRIPNLDDVRENFWYMEIGGDFDTIVDSEFIRDELLKIAYGVWDFVKNDPKNYEKNRNWTLDWMGFHPGRRESRRYVGDHLLNQNDVRAWGKFEDIVAYGGWKMDDHDPSGIATTRVPTIFHESPSPYGIPYRSLYSVNIENLFCAGRNISATHTAMSSTRVMATCSVIGQAVGLAAGIAVREGISPRQVGEKHIDELQQSLLENGFFLPGVKRRVPKTSLEAELICEIDNADALRNGWDRPIGENDNGCYLRKGQSVIYLFDTEKEVNKIRVVFDNDLNYETLPETETTLKRNMYHNYPLDRPLSHMPKTQVKSFKLEALLSNGQTEEIYSTDLQIQRLFRLSTSIKCKGIRLTPIDTWGSEKVHLFSFDVTSVDDQ